MKHIFLFLIFFSISIFAQKNNPDFKLFNSATNELSILNKTSNSNKSTTFIQKIDSTLIWQDDVAPWGFLGHPVSRGINWTYDANNNLTSAEDQLYNSTLLIYEKSILQTFTYDLFNNQTNYLIQTWNSSLSAWVNFQQFSYSFDINNNKISDLEQTWSAGAWLNQNLTTITYDINHNILTQLTQTWSAGAWLNQMTSTSTYNSNNKEILRLNKQWNASTTSWKDNSRFTFTYDINNDNVYFLLEKWTTAWVNNQNYTYTYDLNHNQLSIIEQYWSGGWINEYKYLYVYDASNNRISSLSQSWNIATSAWKRDNTSSSNYDINNFIKNNTVKYYDNTTGININSEDSVVWYFHTVVGVDELLSKKNSLTIYPNPSNGTFKVITEAQISSIDVYNGIGMLVAKPEIINSEVNLSILPSGIYFLKVYSNKQLGVTKVVIEWP